MNEGRRLQGVAWSFAGHLVRGEPAQVLIHERQQFCRGFGVALMCRLQNTGEVAHGFAASFRSGAPGASMEITCFLIFAKRLLAISLTLVRTPLKFHHDKLLEQKVWRCW